MRPNSRSCPVSLSSAYQDSFMSKLTPPCSVSWCTCWTTHVYYWSCRQSASSPRTSWTWETLLGFVWALSPPATEGPAILCLRFFEQKGGPERIWPQNGHFWCSDSTYDQCNISVWRPPKKFDPHLSAQIDLNKVCPVLQDPLLPATSIMWRTMTQLTLWMC